MTIRTVHMDFLYGGAFREGAAGGVRAADPRRDARRRDAVHALGRDRGAVGARRRDRRRRGSATGRRSRTTPPARGGRRRPTSCCTATGGPGGGTDVDVARDVDGRGRHRSPRSSASSRACATRRRRGAAAEPAHERDDAHRVGAAAVASRRRSGRSRGWRSAIPSRTIAARSAAPDEEDGLDVDLSVRCFPIGDRAVASEVIWLRLRGDRAAAPASIVLPLADLRPAGVPALARRAAVRRRRSSSSSSRSPTGSSSTRPSGTSCATASSRSCSTARPCRTSRGRGRTTGA